MRDYNHNPDDTTDIDKWAIIHHHGNYGYGYKADKSKIPKEYQHFFTTETKQRAIQQWGQAVTPAVFAHFMTNSIEFLLTNLLNQYPNRQFSRHPLGDEGVRVIDPFVGTGIFMDLIIRFHLTEQQLRDKWDTGYLQCFEYSPDIALICAINMELAYATITGEYRRCRFVACIDTHDQDPETGSYYCQQDNKHYTNNEMWHAFSV